MDELFVRLKKRYDRFKEESKGLEETGLLQGADGLLREIRESVRTTSDPEQKGILFTLAHDLGEIIFAVSGRYPSVRLMFPVEAPSRPESALVVVEAPRQAEMSKKVPSRRKSKARSAGHPEPESPPKRKPRSSSKGRSGQLARTHDKLFPGEGMSPPEQILERQWAPLQRAEYADYRRSREGHRDLAAVEKDLPTILGLDDQSGFTEEQ